MIKIRRKEDLLRIKDKLSVREVYLSLRLTKKLAVALASLFPNLRRVYLPPSLFELADERVVRALRSIGVEVVPTGRGRGRPAKYTEATLKMIVEKYRSGERVKDISRDLGIPVRTVYHLIRKLDLRGKTPQHKGLRDL